MDLHMAVPAHPCATRHLNILFGINDHYFNAEIANHGNELSSCKKIRFGVSQQYVTLNDANWVTFSN